MASLRFLKGFDAIILDVHGKSYYLKRDKPEWDFLFNMIIREASEGSVKLDRPVDPLDIETLRKAFIDRGGQISGKPSLKTLNLDLEKDTK